MVGRKVKSSSMMNVLLYKYFVLLLFSLGNVLGHHSQHTFCHRASVVCDCLDAHVLLPTRKTDKWRSLGTKGLTFFLDSHFILHQECLGGLFFAGNYNYHKNWVPSILPHNLCLISMRMKKKIIFLV